MPNRRGTILRLSVLAGVIAAAVVIYACSSSKNPSSPYGGGGGGGGGGAKELDSGNITNGTTFSHAFNTVGSFSYHCIYHAGMTGTVVVNAGGSTVDTTINQVTSGANPTVVCKTGGTVRWHNATGTTHTVTSN